MRRPPPDRGPIVYFIRAGGDPDAPIKIGTTTGWAEKRMAALQTGCPTELQFLCYVPGGVEREAEIHADFADLHIRGEWFRPGPDFLAFIDAIQRGVEVARRRKRAAQAVTPWPEVTPEEQECVRRGIAAVVDAMKTIPSDVELPLIPRRRGGSR